MKKEEFTPEEIGIIRRINKLDDAVSKDSLDVFLYQCKKTNLDPLLKQIYPIPRRNRNTNEIDITTVTSIDGFRIIAERTGKYAPGKTTEWIHNEKGGLLGATAFVKKMTADGTWHNVGETAFIVEYRPKNGSPFWNNMPSVMISKVAEARALRRAFPDAFASLYSDEEMDQAKEQMEVTKERMSKNKPTPSETISPKKVQEITEWLSDDEDLRSQLLEICKVTRLQQIKETQLDACRNFVKANKKKIG